MATNPDRFTEIGGAVASSGECCCCPPIGAVRFSWLNGMSAEEAYDQLLDDPQRHHGLNRQLQSTMRIFVVEMEQTLVANGHASSIVGGSVEER